MMQAVVAQRDFAKSGARSLRTCVSCGRKAERDDLLRVVSSPEGRITLDWSRKLPGRGVHVCPTRRCIETGVKQRRFDKTLKSKVLYPDPEELLSAVRVGLSRQLETLMRSAVGSRFVAIGVDSTGRSVGEGKAYCAIVAVDCTSRAALETVAKNEGVPVRFVDSKEILGAFMGRSSAGAVAVLNRGLAGALVGVFDRIENLGWDGRLK